MKKRRRLKKKIRNRLILAFGLLITLFILITLIKGIVGLFHSDNKTMNNEKITEEIKGSETLRKAGMSEEDIKEMTSLPNYRSNRAKRYAKWKAKSVKDIVMQVNCDIDLKPYSKTTIIDDDSDMTLLVNKFYALPAGYQPSDLVPLEDYACVQGEDYSCQTVEQIEMRKEAYDAYVKFCKAAAKNDINIRAIAGYRTYEYQKGLWDYYASVNGEEYADQYYARPGQSEHNSGLAVDITFNGYNFNEIENYDGYDWILKNMHKYGFILRYPEDKTDVTQYGYESWHIRYVGKEAATKIYKNNWTLEEYHGSK